jgi:hypothetical protein
MGYKSIYTFIVHSGTVALFLITACGNASDSGLDSDSESETDATKSGSDEDTNDELPAETDSENDGTTDGDTGIETDNEPDSEEIDTDSDRDMERDTDNEPNPPDCSDPMVLCVDDTPGPTQEYASIQVAADAVGPGQTIAVFDGHYAGFELSTSGAASDRIVIRTVGEAALIDSDGPDGCGVFLHHTSYVTLDGLRVDRVSGRGVAHRDASPTDPSRGLIIRNMTVTSVEREGMYLSEVSESLIENNSISGSGVSDADLTHGIYLANAGSDGTTIRKNHIFENGTAGIHFNGDLSIGGDGIISGLVIEENIIHHNGQNGLNMDGVQDTVVRNNLIFGNASNGLRAYAIDAAEGPKGLSIVNNTFHVLDGGGWCVRITEDLGDNLVFNNVLMNDTETGGSIALDGTNGFASAANAVIDRFTTDRDDTLISLTQWQAKGYDTGSFVAAPAELFMDVQTGDYRLRTDTPAENAGLANFMDISSPTKDIAGRARSGPPDIGAYERE